MSRLKITTIIILITLSALMGQSFQKPDSDKPGKMISAEITTADETSGRIDPFLKHTLNQIDQHKLSGTFSPGVFMEMNKNVRVNQGVLQKTSVPVFIKSKDVQTTISRIKSYGGIIYTVVEGIITAELPTSVTYDFASNPDVVYISGSYIREQLINESRTSSQVNLLHQGQGLPGSYKGKGVIVGIVDSGIDWKHPDFNNGSGNRIQFLWDMSGQGAPPANYNYGSEYSKSQLDLNQSTQIDGDDGGGHGTHVAGTAAGSGGGNPQYMGMAPESEIIFVKGFRDSPGFSDVDVVNGCNYIFQRAAEVQKPAVINLSLGGNFGPHDGTSLYEQALSGLTGEGKIIVAAAGNSGGQNIHLSYTTSGATYNDALETVWLVPENAAGSYIDLWYNNGNISVGIAAYDPSTQNLIGFTNPVSPGQQVQNQAFTVDGVTYGWFSIDATNANDPNNGGKEVFIALESNNGQVDLGSVYWSIYTYGSGTFDAWNIGGEFDTYSVDWFRPGDNQKTIGVPGTANKIICVGSYVTKNSWNDINGATQLQPGNPVIGNISSFSSIGPSRDNRVKPDIVAPGEVIVAALSSDLTQVPQEWILQGGKHQKMQGTSMAAPHVTGVIALLLQKNPQLNYDDVVNILKTTALKDNFTGTQPGNIFGYGKLDAYEAFLSVTGGGGGGGGQITILQEGFDNVFPGNGWEVKSLNQNYTWQQGNLQDQGFNLIDPSSLYSAVCPWIDQDQDEQLITPSFSLGSGSASIEFYAGYSTNWLTSATLNLRISTDNGATWVNLWSADNDGQNWMWRKKTVDLSDYSNKSNLKLSWQYIGNDGDFAGVDGIKLNGFQFVTSTDDLNVLPQSFAVHQNFPNPFNPSTTIRYQLPEQSEVTLKIMDILGNEVSTLVNEVKPAGNYEFTLNASGLSSGVYFYRLNAGSFTSVRKMTLLK
jgi:minor extracellular serine protease Vpr